jgi:hypothetical protein
MKFRPVGADLFSAVGEEESHEEAISLFALQIAVRFINHMVLVKTSREQDVQSVLITLAVLTITTKL